jgi:hypothetical protein
MRKIVFFLGIFALAFTILISPVFHTSVARPTVTISDSTPTYTTSSGEVIHKSTITVAPGSTVNILLQGPVLPGYKWELTWIEAHCTTGQDVRSGAGGLLGCSGKTLRPTLSARTGDPAAGYEFTQKGPELSASGNQFEATIQVPNHPTTVRVTYAYFPPLKPGQTSNESIKVFEVYLIVH